MAAKGTTQQGVESLLKPPTGWNLASSSEKERTVNTVLRIPNANIAGHKSARAGDRSSGKQDVAATVERVALVVGKAIADHSGGEVKGRALNDLARVAKRTLVGVGKLASTMAAIGATGEQRCEKQVVIRAGLVRNKERRLQMAGAYGRLAFDWVATDLATTANRGLDSVGRTDIVELRVAVLEVVASAREVLGSRGNMPGGVGNVAAHCRLGGFFWEAVDLAELDPVASAGAVMGLGRWFDSMGLEEGDMLVESLKLDGRMTRGTARPRPLAMPAYKHSLHRAGKSSRGGSNVRTR